MKAKEKSSDSQWLKSVVSSGTLNDKVAALSVQVQVSKKKKCPNLFVMSLQSFSLNSILNAHAISLFEKCRIKKESELLVAN